MSTAHLEAKRERDAVCEAAAHWACCHPADLIGGGPRSPDLRLTRQAVCWELVRRGLALAEVGRLVKLDHTTVLNACRRIDRLRLEEDAWMLGLLEAMDGVPLGVAGHMLEMGGQLIPIRRIGNGKRWRIITRGRG